jgi:hypothetical protein
MTDKQLWQHLAKLCRPINGKRRLGKWGLCNELDKLAYAYDPKIFRHQVESARIAIDPHCYPNGFMAPRTLAGDKVRLAFCRKMVRRYSR